VGLSLLGFLSSSSVGPGRVVGPVGGASRWRSRRAGGAAGGVDAQVVVDSAGGRRYHAGGAVTTGRRIDPRGPRSFTW